MRSMVEGVSRGRGLVNARPLHRLRSQACAGCASSPAMGGSPPPLRGGG